MSDGTTATASGMDTHKRWFLLDYEPTSVRVCVCVCVCVCVRERERERERDALVVLKQEALRSEDILERTYFPSFQS